MSSSWKHRFTPVLKLEALQIAMEPAARSISPSCSGVKPVVPITIATLCFTHSATLATVAPGTVKSMSTSICPITSASLPTTGTPLRPWPDSSPESAPRKLLPGCSIAAASSSSLPASAIASTRVRPIRPAAPVMPTLVVIFSGRQKSFSRPRTSWSGAGTGRGRPCPGSSGTAPAVPSAPC